MLSPKQITHAKRISSPKLPNNELKASDVRVTPCDDELSQTPEIKIIRAVAVQIINVSNDNNSVNLTNSELIKKFYNKSKLKYKIDENECLFSNRKIKEMHSKFLWR